MLTLNKMLSSTFPISKVATTALVLPIAWNFSGSVAAADAFDTTNKNASIEHRSLNLLYIDLDETCAADNPCGVCQGSCDADSDCANGLNCVEPDANGLVHGCLGIISDAATKVCYVPDVTRLRDAEGGCSDAEPCGLCEGACTEDAQCDGDLHCYLRTGLESIPGCQEGGVSGQGYCAAPVNNLEIVKREFVETDEAGNEILQISDDCTPEHPCGVCQGDCDNDNQCAGDLVCYERRDQDGNSLGDVPGCYGEGEPNMDYCVDPLSFFDMQPKSSEAGAVGEICEAGCNVDEDCFGALACLEYAAEGDLPFCNGYDMYIGQKICYPEQNTPVITRPSDAQCTNDDKCGFCEGDCDNDVQCGKGLRCFQRNRGTTFDAVNNWCDPGDRLNSGTDYCVPYDTPSLTEDGSGTFLGLCDGDCSIAGNECAYGLKCIEADATGNVPGCEGTGMGSYCYDATEWLDEVETCDSTTPCGLCEGGCSTNDDCAADLECFTRSGLEHIPGCKGVGSSGVGYCHAPNHNIMELGDCNDTDRKCGLCEGDCDNDAQCADGLWCFQRGSSNAFESVPGCNGIGFNGEADYCYRPELCYGTSGPADVWSNAGEFQKRCNFKELADYINELTDANGEGYFRNANCRNSAEQELTLLLGASTQGEAEDLINDMCGEAYENWTGPERHFPFEKLLDRGVQFDKEYYDGNSNLNTERETIVEYNYKMHELDEDFERIDTLRDTAGETQVISWPYYLPNFDKCQLNAINCCWVQDRQANDNNGNCAEPYDENCIDANPADNTDICYVDMSKSTEHNHVNGGFAIFAGEDEDDAHCHGFAWSDTDDRYENNLYKGNGLFFVSMYDHFHNRGYVRNVPGAPMCACLEKTPIVSRSDCTEIDARETVEYEFDPTERTFAFHIQTVNVNYNACRGLDGENNDLEAFYRKLVEEGHISESKLVEFEKIIVGDDNGDECANAITAFLETKGITATA